MYVVLMIVSRKMHKQTDGLATNICIEGSCAGNIWNFGAKTQDQPPKMFFATYDCDPGRSIPSKAFPYTERGTWLLQHQLLVHIASSTVTIVGSNVCNLSFPITTSVHAARTIRLINLEREGYHRWKHLSSASEANIKIYCQLIPFRYLRGLIGRQAAVLRMARKHVDGEEKGERKQSSSRNVGQLNVGMQLVHFQDRCAVSLAAKPDFAHLLGIAALERSAGR